MESGQGRTRQSSYRAGDGTASHPDAVLNGDLEQVRNVLAIEKRRADLWGLDAPKNVEVLGAFANVGGDTNVAGLLLERLQTLASLSAAPIDPNVIEVEQS